MNNNVDLYAKKYTLFFLRENIYVLSLWDILKTQTLDESFAFHFILNKNIQLLESEEKITIHDVLYWQPHLDPFLLTYMTLFCKQDCSFPNFEAYASSF